MRTRVCELPCRPYTFETRGVAQPGQSAAFGTQRFRRFESGRPDCKHADLWAAWAGYGDCGSLAEPRLVTGAEGGGTTGPMSPSGASSRSTITGA
jgi:hypothetical protein